MLQLATFPSFRQMSPSSLPSVAIETPHYLNDFMITFARLLPSST